MFLLVCTQDNSKSHKQIIRFFTGFRMLQNYSPLLFWW